MTSEALATLSHMYPDSESEETAKEENGKELENSSSEYELNIKEKTFSAHAKPKLVSYFDEAVISDEEDFFFKHRRSPPPDVTAKTNVDPPVEMSARVHQEVQPKLSELDVELPPEPTGRCSNELRQKIVSLTNKLKGRAKDMNDIIQKRKSFRNPSIYEKLIQYCNIHEFGTNYLPNIYDPNKWDSSSYYDELAKCQKEKMIEKKRQEKTNMVKPIVLFGKRKALLPDINATLKIGCQR